jgi:putative transposase
VLKEVDAGAKVQDVVRRLGITETTFYRWKSKFGGLEVSVAKRLRALEDENRRLKTMVADQALDIQGLKHLLGRNGRARRASLGVDELAAKFAMKKRRACRVVGPAPATYHYRARRLEVSCVADQRGRS